MPWNNWDKEPILNLKLIQIPNLPNQNLIVFSKFVHLLIHEPLLLSRNMRQVAILCFVVLQVIKSLSKPEEETSEFGNILRLDTTKQEILDQRT